MNSLKEKWIGQIYELTLGRGDKAVKIGGGEALPFGAFEGQLPHRPVVAVEISDRQPTEWPPALAEVYGQVWQDPILWAKKGQELGADLICLHLEKAHPDLENVSPQACGELARQVAEAIDLPLLVLGCGIAEKDELVLAEVAKALAGQGALLGYVTPDNYQKLALAAQKYDHNLLAGTPLDINLAKQLNILLTEMGLESNRIVNDPLVGALGYGIEYGYSIMERSRVAALTGDQMLSMPLLCMVGAEAWKTREAVASQAEFPEWGEQNKRGLLWEALTAAAYVWAGAEIVILRHPESWRILRTHWDNLL